MRARIATLLIALAVPAAICFAQANTPRATLDIYVLDVEGGNSQLWVMPSGESVLVYTGNGPGAAAVRDVDRIMAAVKDAGVTQIDHLIITHYHGDHFGGVTELAKRIPIKEFIDHGANVQPNPQTDALLRQYAELYAKAKHTVPKPGDKLAVSGVDWRVVSVAAQTIKTPLPGAPGAGAPNPLCASFRPNAVNPITGAPLGHSEDEQVIASHVTFGRFRAVYLADLDWNQEPELVCPNNLLGTVDFFVVSRHAQSSSNSEALVHAIRPRVIVTNNGLRKGGQPSLMKILLSSPGLEDLWQLHFAYLSGQEYTVPGMFIANLDDASVPVAPLTIPPGTREAQIPPVPLHNGPAFWIKVSARKDGGFTVTNSRNGFTKSYKPRS